MLATDETNITEIELLPDGRICVFGTSLKCSILWTNSKAGSTSPAAAALRRVAVNPPKQSSQRQLRP